MEDKHKDLREVADKTAKWLRRLERKAAVLGENNRRHLPAFSASCFADACNYGAVASDIEAALTKASAK